MNLIAAWKNLPQRTKLLLVGLLLSSSLGLWYGLLYAPNPTGLQSAPPMPSPSPTPSTLEVPALPPFKPPDEAPKAAQEPKPKPQGEAPQAAKTTPPPTVPKAEPIPPNPFVPLLTEAPPPLPAPPPVALPRPTPLPSGPPVQARVGSSPSAVLPASPRPLPGSTGPLPLPKALAPSLTSLSPPPPPERLTGPEPPLGLVETLLGPIPGESQPPQTEGQPLVPASPPKTALEAFVQERGLIPVATLLGPIGVAVLQTKEGYLVLALGEKIPGSEVIVKGLEPDQVVLALRKDGETEVLTLPVKSGGSP